MTVQELINELEKIHNKDKKVFVYQPSNPDGILIAESKSVQDN